MWIKTWIRIPEQLDACFRDHFGLRDVFIRADALLNKNLRQNGNHSVLLGDNGRMSIAAMKWCGKARD